MGRRSNNEGIPEMLLEILEFVFRFIPPWTSIPLAGIGFLLIVLLGDAQVKFPPFHTIGVMFGIIFAVACLVAGWNGFRLRQRQQAFLRANIDMQWVRGLTWQDFERQMAVVYRQKGYQVEETGGGGADGGIDLKLFKNGRTTVVQCKHWKTWKVNVKPIRELFGVMAAEGADSAIFITSGRYTGDALKFAEGQPIELIDRDGFFDLVRCFQKDLQKHYGTEPAATQRRKETPEAAEIPPNCPICQSPMKLRTAKRGAKAGSRFWGCSRYPDCHGTLDYTG
jgi:restriction system protein